MFQYPKIKKTKKIKEDYNDYFNKLTLDLYHDNAIRSSVKKQYEPLIEAYKVEAFNNTKKINEDAPKIAEYSRIKQRFHLQELPPEETFAALYFNNGNPDDWTKHQRVSNSRYNSTTALFNDIKNRERGTEFENSSYPYPDLSK